MHLDGHSLNQLSSSQCGFQVKTLELRNQQPLYGNNFYLVSGENNMLLIQLTDAGHENIQIDNPERLLATSTASNPINLNFIIESANP